MTEPDFEALRREFPVLARKTYLNSGSYCALANEVRAAFEAYLEDRLLVGANWDVWITKNESVRALTRIAVARVARRDRGHGLRLGRPQCAGERPRLLRPAQQGCGERLRVPHQRPDLARAGATRRPCRACAACRRRLHSARDVRARRSMKNTQLVAITHVCFRNGAKLDIPGIVRLAHAEGRARIGRLLSIGRLPGHRREGLGCGLCGGRNAQVSPRNRRHRVFVCARCAGARAPPYE